MLSVSQNGRFQSSSIVQGPKHMTRVEGTVQQQQVGVAKRRVNSLDIQTNTFTKERRNKFDLTTLKCHNPAYTNQ